VLSVLFTAGWAVATVPGRADEEPPASTTVTVVGRYRGVTAPGWAKRYRAVHKLYRAARGEVRRVSRSLAMHQPSYGTSALERGFLCIHSHEGSWTDPNAPFYGGLQMDNGFQATYGDWALRAFGTADRWPVSVQIAVAIRAYVSGRGFGPWPNTRRMCGI
jgi:hypothetical protein